MTGDFRDNISLIK